jgi:hypothetical protein
MIANGLQTKQTGISSSVMTAHGRMTVNLMKCKNGTTLTLIARAFNSPFSLSFQTLSFGPGALSTKTML